MLGHWESLAERGRQNPRLTLASDPAAPGSPPGIIVTKFPAGLVAGRGPVNWAGWDSAGHLAGQKSQVYLSLWIRIRGADYENESVGTKLGFIGYGQSPEHGTNQGYFLLKGTGREVARPSFRMRFVQQNHVSRSLEQNMFRGPVMTCGEWHHLEALFQVNSASGHDGVFKMWMDGRLAIAYTNVVYKTPAQHFNFTSWRWNPTWGGRDGVRSRDDFIEIDDVYLSGLP
jgi:hypothetical protein